MNTERLLSKLKPLIPERVNRWRSVRELCDPDMKALIDKQIAYEGQRLLGNYREKILLSLPDEGKGEIKLGKVIYDEERHEAGLSKKELMQHVGIFGRSGAGKSNTVFHILKQLDEKRVPFLFLDWKRTARHLIHDFQRGVKVYTPGRTLSQFQFNPFVVPRGMERNVYSNFLIDVMAEAYTLGDGAKRILQKALDACYASGNVGPSMDDVLKEVQKIPDKERQTGWKISTVRALESLKYFGMSPSEVEAQFHLTEDMAGQNTIIELDALDQSSKKFLIPMLALWLYHSKLSTQRREKLNLVLVLEEAHHVLYRQEKRSKESLMNMLLRQCREIGIGVIIVDQHPHLISAAALGNTYTTICLNLKDPTDINKAAGLSMLDAEDKRYLTMLPVGYGIVKMQDRWREPFLVKFPLVDVKKGSVSDRDLELYLRSVANAGESQRPTAGEGDDPRITERVLSQDAFTFLNDVLNHPEDGVRIRYARLGMSADRGTRMKNDLVAKGWLAGKVIQVGENSRKVVLKLTEWARATLGSGKGDDLPGRIAKNHATEALEARSGSEVAPRSTDGRRGHESIQHEYLKWVWAEKMAQEGYQVAVEAPRRGGRVDVLAVKGDERIGVEIETGESDIVANVTNGLLSGFDRIIVVATDTKALRQIEKELGRARLLGIGRVEVAVGIASHKLRREDRMRASCVKQLSVTRPHGKSAIELDLCSNSP